MDTKWWFLTIPVLIFFWIGISYTVRGFEHDSRRQTRVGVLIMVVSVVLYEVIK